MIDVVVAVLLGVIAWCVLIALIVALCRAAAAADARGPGEPLRIRDLRRQVRRRRPPAPAARRGDPGCLPSATRTSADLRD
jgi:hypothetical protein